MDDIVSEEDLYDHVSSSPSINEEEVDFQYVYALKTFTATEQGQANAYKGDAMILLNDTNSYWWLVRMIKDSSIGFLPAEHIETPWERLARLNKYRNGENSAVQTHSNPFGRLFKSASMKRSKDKDKSASHSLSSKNVSFMPQETYISASEWEYSDDESSVNGLEDNSDDEDRSPSPSEESRQVPGPAELLKDSNLAEDDITSPVFNGVYSRSQRSIEETRNNINSSSSNSDDETYVDVPEADTSKTLLIKKTRHSPPLENTKALNLKGSEPLLSRKEGKKVSAFPTKQLETVEEYEKSRRKSDQKSAEKIMENKQLINGGQLVNGRQLVDDIPLIDDTQVINVKQVNGKQVNVIEQSVNGIEQTIDDDIQSPIKSDIIRSVSLPSADIDKSRPISTFETQKDIISSEQEINQTRSFSSPIPRPLSSQPERKSPQNKRRSFLRTKSSIDVLFGLDKNKESKNNDKLQAPNRSRNVSISSNSSAGSSNSGRSAFSRMFKRKKSKKQMEIEPGSPLTPDEENISNAPFSDIPWSKDISEEEPMKYGVRTDSLRHAASSDAIMAMKKKHRDGYTTPPVSSNTTGPLAVMDKRTSEIDFIANRASIMSSTARRPRPLDLSKRPLSTPSEIRKSPLGSPRSLDNLPWPSNHLSFHESGPLQLPNGANLVDNGSARTSILSASDIPESYQSAEIGCDNDDDSIQEDFIQEDSIQEDAIQEELIHEKEEYPQHILSEQIRSNSAASASTESTVPTLEEHYRGQSPANDVIETPRSNASTRMTNPVIKRFWNGSSASSIGSQHLEAPSMGSVTTVSESSVLSVATADSKVANDKQSFDNLHPEISLMYKETHRRIDNMTSRIDMLLNIYKS